MKLQVALDFLNLDQALKVAKDVALFVDILEAGTPLIKSTGMESVRQLKALFPDKIIDADLKTADVGDLEVKMAAEAGASLIHVLGLAPLETIEEAVLEAKKFPGVKIVVDICGALAILSESEFEKRIRQIEETGPDYLEIHTAISQQRKGEDPFGAIKKVSSISKLPLSVAGGINKTSVEKLRGIANLEIIIVGGGITQAASPKTEAQEIKNIIQTF
jgi:3-hexulose-6-phosphate synthase/6-phospho-3-hexuloisomerase